MIEHTFVTTMEAPQAMQVALQFLSLRGFQGHSDRAFPVGGTWDSLEMRRGKKKAHRAKHIAELPQTAHLNFDRGRVTVVLTIEPSQRWGGGGRQLQIGSAEGNPKKMRLHARMLSSIATGLEQVLARNVAPGAAAQDWAAADEEAIRWHKRIVKRNLIIVIGFLAVVATIVTLVIVNG